MKSIALLIVWLGSGALGAAQDLIAHYDWKEVARAGEQSGGTPVALDGRSALRIRNTNDTPLQAALLKIQGPPISNSVYAIVGEVKYENVHGHGYLEMWNYFPPARPGLPEGQFFSRTLGESGQMGRLTGTSDWRPFLLPFDRTGVSDPPTRLELNLFLPGPGTVHLSSLKLIQYAPGAALAASPRLVGWWSERTAGLIGGIGGALLGVLGGLLGSLAARGKARAFVVTTLTALMALGGILAMIGLAALALRQPYAVWFPLILIAVLLLSILPSRLRHYRRQYEELELRRMASMDAAG